jgi:hypothetical protein
MISAAQHDDAQTIMHPSHAGPANRILIVQLLTHRLMAGKRRSVRFPAGSTRTPRPRLLPAKLDDRPCPAT